MARLIRGAQVLEQWFTQLWYRRGFNLWSLLLRPWAMLFGALATYRRQRYQQGNLPATAFDVPLIVVGNITVGGTGKTPLVAALTQRLKHAGWHPGIISRGYGAAQDEPKLLAAQTGVPVIIHPRRVIAATQLRADHPEVNLILSDDGLQHYALKRDIEIAVVDGARGFGNGQLLPAGPLREPVARLREVQCIVCNGDPAPDLDLDIGPAVFPMQLANERFIALKGKRTLERLPFLREMGQKRIYAIAGIGHPQRFFAHLEKLGVTCAAQHSFADHYPFQPQDMRYPEADIILMTEKDAVKCAAFDDPRLWMMQVEALLPEAFFDFVINLLAEKSAHVTRPKAA